MSSFKAEPAEAGRIYRPRLRSRIFFAALGLGLLWAGSSLAIWANSVSEAILASRVIATVVALLIGLPGAYMAANMFVRKVVLYPDRIEARSVFGSRFLRRDAILGYRATNGQLLTFTFTPRPPAKRSLKVWPGLIDQDFADWFEGLTSFDRAEFEEARREVLSDPALGPDEAARDACLKKLTKLTGYSGLGLVILVPGLLFTLGPVWAGCVLAVAPVVALFAVYLSRGAITLTPSTQDGLRPSVEGAGFCILFLCALTIPCPILDWSLAIGLASMVAVIVFVVTVLSDPRTFRHWDMWVLGAFIALLYGWGLTIHGNALLDRGKPEIYHAQVEDLQPRDSRLYLAPIGPFQGSITANAPESVRKSARVGESVCLNIHPGAFGIRWYDVRECD